MELKLLRSVPKDMVWTILHFHVKTKILYTHKSKFIVETEMDPIDIARLARWRKAKIRRLKKWRNGCSILIHFEYELCVFRKLIGYGTRVNLPRDKFLIACIRWMSWNKSTSTVLSDTYSIYIIMANIANVTFLIVVDGMYTKW